jgi:hypothetical protein
MTTLEYQGTLTGYTLYYPTGDQSSPVISDLNCPITAEVILSGSLADNDLTVSSYTISGPVQADGHSLGSGSGLYWLLTPGWMSLTTENGAITGANFGIYESPGNGAGDETLNLDSSGVTLSVGHFSPGSGIGTQTYGSGSGSWTQAPEIDPASMGAGLTILCIVAILMSRRK